MNIFYPNCLSPIVLTIQVFTSQPDCIYRCTDLGLYEPGTQVFLSDATFWIREQSLWSPILLQSEGIDAVRDENFCYA